MTNFQAPNAPTLIEKQPAHEQVYHAVKEQILFGELAPGQAVTIQGLADSEKAGMTPVREAIRRLISEGGLVFQGNRRVSVPTLRPSDIEELVFLRKTTESELTRRACKRVAPSHLTALQAIDARLDHAISVGDISQYLRLNYAFHMYLYAVAEAPILAEMSDRLWLRFGPSLRVVCGRFGTENLPDRHKELIHALSRKDTEAAMRAIVHDVEQGLLQMSEALAREPA